MVAKDRTRRGGVAFVQTNERHGARGLENWYSRFPIVERVLGLLKAIDASVVSTCVTCARPLPGSYRFTGCGCHGGDHGTTDSGEMMAIAWSYAAAVRLDVDPATVFHSGGYRGWAGSIIDNFSAGRYFGVPMLQWIGLTFDENKQERSGSSLSRKCNNGCDRDGFRMSSQQPSRSAHPMLPVIHLRCGVRPPDRRSREAVDRSSPGASTTEVRRRVESRANRMGVGGLRYNSRARWRFPGGDQGCRGVRRDRITNVTARAIVAAPTARVRFR